ncbi:MAG: hypothetical protein CVV30_08635 [Methanomicrobiales archaeon HGW-Methanomicrobiales-1]|jgi:hypothetical protein|nr:MAG: hypothetical protein CVV30_08635 [Methanomicrobiales archaeon HGW-Methanomicrobiales-1]
MNLDAPLYDLQRIKIFLSYSTKDKHTAGTIKYQLVKLGYDVFLAHHDLEPSQVWVEEILRNLDNCDIFLPFLTENCFNSFWVNQEIGIGFIKNKLIMPFTINRIPWGFISHIQAYCLDASSATNLYNDIQNACSKIEKIMTSKDPEKMRDTLIFALDKSGSYETSNKIAISLMKCGLISADQVNEIIRIFLKNDQVNQAYEGRNLILDLFTNYYDAIDSEFEEILRDNWDF